MKNFYAIIYFPFYRPRIVIGWVFSILILFNLFCSRQKVVSIPSGSGTTQISVTSGKVDVKLEVMGNSPSPRVHYFIKEVNTFTRIVDHTGFPSLPWQVEFFVTPGASGTLIEVRASDYSTNTNDYLFVAIYTNGIISTNLSVTNSPTNLFRSYSATANVILSP